MTTEALCGKLLWRGLEFGVTIARPIVDPLVAMRKNPKIAGITIIAMIALALCAHYVKTKPMLTLNHFFSQISYFLKNPVHARLVGGIGGICYFLIGRELINRDKLRYGWDKNDPHLFPLIGSEPHENLNHNEVYFLDSPIYKSRWCERKREREEYQYYDLSTFSQKAKTAAATGVAILTAPIITPIYKYPKAASITLLALLILSICAHYVHTKPMQNFNNALLKFSHDIATFLKNPSYAILASIFGSMIYLGIGREVVHANKIDFAWDEKRSTLSMLWGIGDRQKLLRELDHNLNHLNNGIFGQNMISQVAFNTPASIKYFHKVEKEGTFYLEPEIFLNEHNEKTRSIFFNFNDGYNDHLYRLDIFTENKCTLDFFIRKLIGCGYSQVY